jgi:hypothetical protein
MVLKTRTWGGANRYSWNGGSSSLCRRNIVAEIQTGWGSVDRKADVENKGWCHDYFWVLMLVDFVATWVPSGNSKRASLFAPATR